MLLDLRYALRALRKRPGFTIVAIVTLAVGIGANTAIFSIVNATLLRALPFANPDELMQLSLVTPNRLDTGSNGEMVWSYPKYTVLRDHNRSYSDLAPYFDWEFTMVGAESPERVDGEIVGARYFSMLGIRPKAGRSFIPDDDRTPGTATAAMIGEGLWNRKFNANPNVIGSTIKLDGKSYTIVGVAPASFKGLTGRAEVWLPLMSLDAQTLNQRWSHFMYVVGRLKPGVTQSQAEAEAVILGKRIDEMHPDPVRTGDHWSARAQSLETVRVDPAIRRSVLVLFGAVAAVLLIACVNVANLLLARAVTRRREIAVRLAIGANRTRLIRQLITESLVLALAGAVAGAGVAALGVKLLTTMLSRADNAFGRQLSGLSTLSLSNIRLDGTALAFMVAAAVITGLLFGVMPALQSTRANLTQDLKEGGSHGSTVRSLTSRSALVVAELALAMVLLVGSGLMLRSLAHLLNVDPGFRSENMLTLRMSQPMESDQASRARFWEELIPRVRALPGVQNVAMGDCPPLAGGCNRTVIWFRDRPEQAKGTEPLIGVHWVTSDYFKTLSVPLLNGRLLDERDTRTSPKVVLINDAAARAFYPGQNPIGRKVGVGQGGFQDTVTIVGVVGNERFTSMEEPPKPDVFISYGQSPRPHGMLYVKTAASPTALTNAIRREVRAVNPNVPVFDIQTMDQRASEATARTRFSATLLGIFAAIALVLAAVGIYGVISFAVSQRTREIGVRVALGAARRDVMGMVLRQGLALTAAGIVNGVAGAWMSTRVLTSMLYDVQPNDPFTFVALALLLTIVSCGATLLPAFRAARVDPMEAFRTE